MEKIDVKKKVGSTSKKKKIIKRAGIIGFCSHVPVIACSYFRLNTNIPFES
jgi:hypothetical protein